VRLGVMLGYFGAGTTAGEQVELAREAERLGYDSAWVAEAYGSDAATVLAWLAAQTSASCRGGGSGSALACPGPRWPRAGTASGSPGRWPGPATT
jgi:hypothetical protein